MQTWQWWAAGVAGYVVVALLSSGIDWHSLSGRAGTPIYAPTLRGRWRVYGMPLPVLAMLPLIVATLALMGLATDAVRLMRRVTGRQYDNETARTRKGWSLAEAMENPAPSVAPAPASVAVATQGTAEASRGELSAARSLPAIGR